jgi:type II secretory ATPase GspE/PulE/Tfp pilus assembly ATPase PilB-like protein
MAVSFFKRPDGTTQTLDGKGPATLKKPMDGAVASPASMQELQKKLQFNEKFKNVTNKIHSANNTDEIIISVKDDILDLIDSERITIYGVDPTKNELYSKFLTPGSEIKEIRVPISTSSIAGCTASLKQMLNIPDVYDESKLKIINPKLNFDQSWDKKSGFRTKQVIAVPISYDDRLFGVIQLINTKTGEPFSTEDEDNIKEVANVLATALRNNAKMGNTRFDFLVNNNIITRDELERGIAIAREQKKTIEEILIEHYKVQKKDIGKALGQFYGCKFILFNENMLIPKDLSAGLNIAFLKKSLWLPIAQVENKVTVLIDNPNDPKTADIKRLVKADEIEYNIALKEDILKFIDSLTKEDNFSESSISDILGEMDIKEEVDGDIDSAGDSTSGAVVRLVNQLLIEGYNKGASDIHVEPNKARKTMDIRFRVDGACYRHLEVPFSYAAPVVSRIKIISNLDIAEKRMPQDGKIKLIYKGKAIEFRVATLPTIGGEDVVMRILASSEPMPLEVLNLSERNLRVLKEQLAKPYGMFLVVGPTGSGKTTTLHAALGSINTPDRKIWTAEDPVEISQYGLRQLEVKPKIELTFARAMRAFLRADPDVVMVGEMRDEETAHIGIEASLTGHLVFSTLHTNSAPETITRLIDMGLDPFNFADALLGILAQRLVRTLCKECKVPYHPERAEFDEMVKIYGEQYFPELKIEYNDKLMLHKPKGCDKCNSSGYRGRTGLHEVLEGTKEMRAFIQGKAKMEVLKEQSLKDGMRTLLMDGIKKSFDGITDMSMVRKVCM